MEDKRDLNTIVDGKKEYTQPAMTILGKVSELTAGGLSGDPETEQTQFDKSYRS